MATRLSAVDVISPAFDQTKRQLFQPFRFGTWARLALAAVLTGEFTSGGGTGPSNFNLPSGTEPEKKLGLLASGLPEHWLEYLPLILAGIVLLMVLWVVLMYVGSVFRFILFDAVLRAKYEIGAGWRRWREAGTSYFLWQLGFGSLVLLAIAVIVGVPALLAWRAGMFDHPDAYLGTLLGYGIVAFLAFGLVILAAMLIEVLAKDFVVPVMAMENVKVLEGWRRLLPMMGGEKGAYAVYVLMKIVLAVGAAILFGILNLIVFLILLIPAGIAGVALFLLWKAAGLTWNPYLAAVAGVLAVAVVFAVLYVAGFVYAPGLVFFQSYALRFLGARYEKLGAELARTWAPAAPPAAGTVTAPAPSPSSP